MTDSANSEETVSNDLLSSLFAICRHTGSRTCQTRHACLALELVDGQPPPPNGLSGSCSLGFRGRLGAAATLGDQLARIEV